MSTPGSLISLRHRARGSRTLLPAALLGWLSTLVLATSAWADGYGELTRFPINPGTYRITEETVAFGVNPTDNSVYVGEEAPPKLGEESGKYRIQRFSASGALLAETKVLLNPKTKGAPGIEGVAVDPALNRVYVLGAFERTAELDVGEPAAGTLYALNAETLASVIPVNPSGTKREIKEEEEGVLADTTALRADGKNPREALLNPAGIAVDPTTHDVLLLGQFETGTVTALQWHVALERVTSEGALRSNPYVEPRPFGEADSPVVTGEGTVLAERIGPDNLIEIIHLPSSESGAEPTVVFHMNPKPFGSGLESPEELLESTESPRGGGLGIVASGSHGTVYAEEEVVQQSLLEGEIASSAGFLGALAVNLEDKAGAVTTSEHGWTGGSAGEVAKCAIAETLGTPGRGEAVPTLAAGKEERLFVLVPQTLQVVEFGPGGEGCPHASVPAGIEASEGEAPPSKEVRPNAQVTLSAQVLDGNVQSVEWEFGDKTAPVTSTTGAYQVPEVTHTFAEVGTYAIKAKIKTDNLATPEVLVERKLKVAYTTTLTTVLSGEGKSGSPLTVQEGVAASDKGTLAGSHVAEASGKVTYTVYSDSACTKEVMTAGLPVAVTAGGSMPSSQGVKLAPGTYYWQASYSGDEKNQASTSVCGSEIEKVEALTPPPKEEQKQSPPPPPPPPVQGVAGVKFTYGVGLASTSLSVKPNGSFVIKVECLGTSGCSGKVTLRTLNAVKASAHKSILTLASGSFRLAAGQTKALTLHLSAKARKLLARVHTLKAKATIAAVDSQGVTHTNAVTVTLRLKRHK
jgi:hypothetical protein